MAENTLSNKINRDTADSSMSVFLITTIMGIFTLLCDATSLAETRASPTPCQIRAYVIDKDPQGLNVRSGSSSHSIIGRLPFNTEVEVFNSQENWVLISASTPNPRVKFQGRGWVYVSLLGIGTRGYDRNSVAVFARASYQSAVVGQIPSRSPIKLLGCQGQWALVEQQRVRGWLPPKDQCAATLTTCP